MGYNPQPYIMDDMPKSRLADLMIAYSSASATNSAIAAWIFDHDFTYSGMGDDCTRCRLYALLITNR